MKESKKVEIDGINYEFGHWMPKHSIRTMTKLIKLLGEPLVAIMFSGDADSEKKLDKASILDAKIDPEIMMKAFHGLSDRLDEDEVYNLIEKACIDGVLKSGKPVSMDGYTGKIGHMLRVSMHNLKHQYSDFLG